MGFINKLFNAVKEIAKDGYENAKKDYYAKQGRFIEKSYQNKKLGNYDLSQWENKWEYIGKLDNLNLDGLDKFVGLYRARFNGKIVYIGRATEYNNRGLKKRLRDYVRNSHSARGYYSGEQMNKYSSEIDMEVLKVGSDQEAAELTKKLEVYFINKYKPEWNNKFK